MNVYCITKILFIKDTSFICRMFNFIISNFHYLIIPTRESITFDHDKTIQYIFLELRAKYWFFVIHGCSHGTVLIGFTKYQ